MAPTEAADGAQLVELSEHLYRWTDSCNAYAVVDGDAAVLVDSGSGRVADALAERGIDVEWVLHTHHHRDQCWGDYRLIEEGVSVAVPEYERYLFEDAERFWASKRLFDNYNDRSTFFTLPRDLPVAASLEDYGSFEWRGHEFEVVPAKGHTYGSSTLVATVDGREVAFTGDLVHEGGTLYQLHAMEYAYGDAKGIPFTFQSLAALEDRDPDLVCPSHGGVITDPGRTVDRLRDRLMELVDLGPHGGGTWDAGDRSYLPEGWNRVYELSPHLLWSGPHANAQFYVLRSGSRGLFIDYGHSLGHHMHNAWDREPLERMRFVEHRIDDLRDRGVEEFDAVIPTHVHDDHTVGIPHLQEQYGVDCWALADVAKVLAAPGRWASTPCAFDRLIEIDRRLADGETVEWAGYELEVRHMPGQTEFASAVGVEVDGRTVAFTGDNYFEADVRRGYGDTETRPWAPTIFRNSFRFDMHRRSARVLADMDPDLVCPGHGGVLEVDQSSVRDYRDYVDRKERAFRAATADPADQGVDAFWARLLPYLVAVRAGETVAYDLRLRNNFEESVTYAASLLGADGRSPVDEGTVTLAPDERGTVEFRYAVPGDARPGRRVLTATVRVDGVQRGPVAEAVVEVE